MIIKFKNKHIHPLLVILMFFVMFSKANVIYEKNIDFDAEDLQFIITNPISVQKTSTEPTPVNLLKALFGEIDFNRFRQKREDAYFQNLV